MVSRAALVLLAFGLSACDPIQPLIGSSDEPVVLLVLSRGPSIQREAPPDSTLHALVVTVGTPSEGHFRAVSQFIMRRRSDLAQFDWVITPRTDGIPIGNIWSVPGDEWNVHLAWNGTGGRLGRADLAGGETYDLDVVTEGRRIIGSVTLPPVPQPVIASDGNHHVITWDSVPGADYYVTDFASPFITLPPLGRRQEFTLWPDTPVEWSPTGWMRIRAYEPQFTRYSRNDRVSSAGLTGALGVFGAFSVDSVWIPPYQPPPPALRASIASPPAGSAPPPRVHPRW